MTRILSIYLFSLYLALFVSTGPSPDQQTLLAPSDPHVSNSWEWSDCGTVKDIVEIYSIEVSPDPPKPGEELTVTASGYVHSTIREGAEAQVTVKLGLIKLLSKTFDVCKEAEKANATVQCPVEPGKHVVVQTVALPKEIPPAKFNVEVRAYNDDNADLMCAKITIDFMDGRRRLSGLRVFG